MIKKFLLLVLLIITYQTKSLNIIELDNTESVLNFVKSYLPEDLVILESGAFNGKDSLLFNKYWPNCTVHSFEPVPQNFKKLIKNVGHLKNIHCYQLALADFTGEANFYISIELTNPNTTSGSGSLLPPKEHIKFDKNIIFPEQIKVQTITLEDWTKKYNIERIDFMWLDMQGYELPMLQKSANILSKVKMIYIELIFVEAYKGQHIYPEIKSWLNSQGFEMIACDFDVNHALKGKEIKPGERYFGNGIFLNKKYMRVLK